ncbi:mitochondrial kynurenine-oxoglutarate transaminase [Andalucia godoyi]|uniref:kynurenine--oxoglutarate transaminase n=1 Tax=Andalucia godoyi TaxID=505711 RepID=A0A8K0AK49_ANDGO|nr:mitochondrial kynurenine-oxoglutarate transaminase [Andalucia godoyi]|eukprot:ANDGO_03897.mRNA.1 mitochondrial kynurenine-oxoglutarate transaminase
MSNRAAARLHGYQTAIWGELTAMSNRLGATNLGQGFPSWDAEPFLKDGAIKAIAGRDYASSMALQRPLGSTNNPNSGVPTQFPVVPLNQYTRSAGHMPLVNRVADMYTEILGCKIDPMTNVLITNGATQAIFNVTQALLNPGDEAIVIDPAYDSYAPCIELAGAKPVHVPLTRVEPHGPDKKNPVLVDAHSPIAQCPTSAEFVLDAEVLERSVTPGKTKLIFVNNPHNPSGKLFSLAELTQIANIAIKHDLVVVSDEVYEFMIYPPVQKLARMASIPGMFERTVTFGSAGKTFSVTGWKIGWCVGPPSIIHPMFLHHQYTVYSVATPLQDAVSSAIANAPEHDYYARLIRTLREKRDKLCNVLHDVGLTPFVPEGAYFVLADTSRVRFPEDDVVKRYEAKGQKLSRDFAFAYWLMEEIGVAAIPPSIFYSPENKHLASNLVRFCFCKDDSILDAAATKLQKLRPFIL